MLKQIHSMEELPFEELMEIYAEGNRENGQDFWPEKSPEEQMMLAKQGFGEYLRKDFFSQPNAVYCLWEEEGMYISALRLEPYQDGLLLEALETIPSHRRLGYAVKLIQAVQGAFAGQKIYAHVSKKNTASLRTHDRCGFQIILDRAVYDWDGTVNENCYTLRYE